MPFVEISEIKGKIYVPPTTPDILKKHACADCAACQVCNDDKCAVCLDQSSSDTGIEPD